MHLTYVGVELESFSKLVKHRSIKRLFNGGSLNEISRYLLPSQDKSWKQSLSFNVVQDLFLLALIILAHSEDIKPKFHKVLEYQSRHGAYLVL